MPVTARLSLKFYERFGEEIAQELVDWLNQVDATYRADLASLNELNFARFDAKLEQRVVELDARFAKRLVELESTFEKRLVELGGRFEKRFADADTALERRLGELRADLLKWVFLFVAGGTATVLGVLLNIVRP